MGLEDRDWFWEGKDRVTGQRRPQTQPTRPTRPTPPIQPTETPPAQPRAQRGTPAVAQPARTTGGPGPVATLLRSPWTYVAILMLAGAPLVDADRTSAGKATDALQRFRMREADARPDATPFPPSGTTRHYRWFAPREHVELDVTTTGLQPGVRHVVLLRDWDSNAAVAEAYLAADSSATVSLPFGRYRFQYADGTRWHDEHDLFGPSTRIREAVAPLEYAAHPDWVAHARVILDPPDGTMATRTIAKQAFATRQ